MESSRSQFEPTSDGDYWSIVAEFIDRRDRGEPVDPVEFAAGDAVLAQRLRECVAGFGWLKHALSGSDSGERPNAGSPMPESIGDYNIIRELGRGGMGVVYEAVHQGLGRRVALKVLFDSSLRGRSARERFLREARTAASLHHTNIVPVFDVGSADGHLYFAMQLIEGPNLECSASCSGEPRMVSLGLAGGSATTATASGPNHAIAEAMEPQRVARLGLQAAEALAYAHARGVVHRDIKPSNLILDSSGTLWVTDFGLARRVDDTPVTATGARVGTPRYMSPEQATAQCDASDPRTDIYSLGVTLYELLTGRPLFSESTPQQLLFQVMRTEPARPRRWNPRVPRDLETIVLKAMAKRPADRYRSAQELADDLRRFLTHQPIRARRIGPVGRTIRWCQREPLVALVSLASLATLGVIVAAYQVNLKGQRDAAWAARDASRRQLGDALFERARAVSRSQETGRRWLALDLLRQAAELAPSPGIRFEAAAALQLFDARPIHAFDESPFPTTAVAIDPRLSRMAVATSSPDGATVSLIDLGTRSITTRLTAPATVNFLTFSRDGRRLAGTTDRHNCVWDLGSDVLQVLPGSASGLATAAFAGDDRRLFGFARGLCEWDAVSGELRARVFDAEVEIGHVVACGGGRVLAAAVATPDDASAEIRRWTLPDLDPLDPLRVSSPAKDPLTDALGILALAAAPTGNTLAASYGDSRIRLWDAATGKALATLEGHRSPPISMAFTPDAEMLISTDRFEIKLWDVASGFELATLVQSSSLDGQALTAVAVADGGLFATGGARCQFWELAAPRFHRVLARPTHAVRHIVATADRRGVAWLSGGRLQSCSPQAGVAMSDWPTGISGEGAIACVPGGNRVALVATGTRRIRILDSETGAVQSEWPAESGGPVAASPDGDELAVAHSDGVIRRWNLATQQAAGALAGVNPPVNVMAYSPDGRWLAVGSQGSDGLDRRTLHVFDVATGRLVRSWSAHRTLVSCLAFSSDSQRVVTCGDDQQVAVWDLSGGRLATLVAVSGPLRGVALSRDDSLIAACGLDGHAFLWDAGSLELQANFSARASGSLESIAFSPDGQWMFAGGGPFRWTHTGPGSVEAWNLAEFRRELSKCDVAR